MGNVLVSGASDINAFEICLDSMVEVQGFWWSHLIRKILELSCWRMDPLKITCILCARIFRGLGIEFRHIFYVYLEGYLYIYISSIHIYIYHPYIHIYIHMYSMYIYVYPHDIPVSCVRLTVPLSLLLLFLPWHQSMIRPPPPPELRV